MSLSVEIERRKKCNERKLCAVMNRMVRENLMTKMQETEIWCNKDRKMESPLKHFETKECFVAVGVC
jgi:hypothetical protein